MPTTRVVRSSHSHSSLSKRRPFQLRTSKSSNFLAVNISARDVDVDDSFSDTRTFNLPSLPKRIISKELISFHTILKRKPSSIVRRMLSLDSDDAYRAQADSTENVGIESESDDDATLVAGLHPRLVKKLEHYQTVSKELNVEQMLPIMLEKKICQYLPGCSDDEDDSAQESTSHDEPTHKEVFDAINTSPCPIKIWSSTNETFDAPGFQIVEEDDRIVYATALSPPPWHRPQESMLVYNPAGPNDEVWSGEPVRDFSW